MLSFLSSELSVIKDDKFSKFQCLRNKIEKNQMKNTPYASIVDSLMYAQICTRADISFALKMLGRYQSDPSMDY